MLKVLDLFSGIGGFSLGLERTGGFETVAFCEIEEFPRKVLAKHWPKVTCYEDVRTLTGERLASDGIAVDVITGGFPCQDISVAGKRAGLDGERSGLWSEIVRLIGDLSPRYVIVENVANLLRGPPERRGGWFGRVLGDLAGCGYDAEWKMFQGFDAGVPQSRPRIYVCAIPCGGCERPILHQNSIYDFSHKTQLDGRSVENADAYNKNCRTGSLPILADGTWPKIPDRERSGTHGRLSDGVDRYKGIGNAVVPQIPEMIGRAILASEQHQ